MSRPSHSLLLEPPGGRQGNRPQARGTRLPDQRHAGGGRTAARRQMALEGQLVSHETFEQEHLFCAQGNLWLGDCVARFGGFWQSGAE
jgi:hypothetical protein